MELFAKAAAVGIAGSLLAVVLRKFSREQAFVLGLLTLAVVVWAGAMLLKPVLETAAALEKAAGTEPALVTPVYRCLGISLVTQLSAEVCRDAGDSAIAQGIRLLGAAAALYVASPLFLAVLELIRQLLEG